MIPQREATLLISTVRWPQSREPWPRTRASNLPRREDTHELQALALPLAVLLVSVLPALVAESHQYTWSLTIFALPAALLLGRLWRSSGARQAGDRRALLRSLVLLVPMGLVLDFLFADELFHFQNREAVLGIYLPAFDLFAVDDGAAIPIEELAFYGCGFLFILLSYSWISRRLGRRPAASDQPSASRRPALWPLLPALLPLTGLVLWLAAGAGILPRPPAYLIFLLVVPSGLTAVLFPGVARRIDWPALILTAATVVWLSFLWEAVMATPSGWWGYRPEAMVGLFLTPHLPIEAVAVWFLAPLTSVVVLETVRLRSSS